MYEKEIQKLKEELKKSKEYINRDKKDKKEVLKKISELTEENQKYIKEKQIIEQELNKKEQELASNKKTIDNLNIKIKLLKDKENDELKKNEAKIKILDKIEVFEDSSMPTKTPQSEGKRDNKVRTFALKNSKIYNLLKDFEINSLPKSINDLNRSENLENEYQKIYIPNLSELLNIERDPTKLKELDVKQIERNLKDGEFYEYELNISDSRIKYLDKIIKENPKMSAKKIDITNQLKSLYTLRKDYFKIKIYDPENKPPNLRSLDDQICKLEDEFRDQKVAERLLRRINL